jgi:hypothetical protein
MGMTDQHWVNRTLLNATDILNLLQKLNHTFNIYEDCDY